MKKILSLLVVAVLSTALVACTGNSNTIKYGVLGPLTGAYAVYGKAVENGAKLAAIEVNEDGGVLGKDLEVIAYDNSADSNQQVDNYNRLVDLDGVDAIIGGTLSGLTAAFKADAVEDGIPVLTPTATNVDITLSAANVFRACYLDSYQGQVMAKFAIEDLDSAKGAVLYNTDDDYSVGLKDAFVAEYGAQSIEVEEFAFTGDSVDFSSQITSIKDGGYDVVFVPTYTDTVGPILQQASAAGLDVPFLGGDGWDSVENDYPTAAEGNYFGNHYAKSEDDADVQAFVSAYETEYGESPNALAALAYDSVKLMAAAMEDAESTDYEAVVSALNAISFTGVTGVISFDSNGDPVNKSVSIIQIADGAQSLVKKFQAE